VLRVLQCAVCVAHGCDGAILQVARGGGGGYSFRLQCAACVSMCCSVLLMDVMVRSYMSLEETEEAISSSCSMLQCPSPLSADFWYSF